MDKTPSEVGARAELEVASALIRSGRSVYLPLLAPDGRVDLIFDDGERGLQRTQCKTSRVVGSVLTFKACSNTRNTPRDYRGEVDVFAVYSPQSGDRWAESYRLRPVAGTEPVPG